jgi:tRNA threonylcarbamoyladenosine modification (KEOPS) complex Cgi121 subunit
LIGSIDYQGSRYAVGITELQNAQRLSKDDFVNLASRLVDDVLIVQFMRPDFIAGAEHLLSASQNALNAWKGEYMISRNLDIEVVLYTSAQRQIDNAFQDMGTVDGLETVALVVMGESKKSVNDCISRAQETVGPEISSPFKLTEKRIRRVREHFEITDTEMEAITTSKDLQDRYGALIRAVVSRVSMVALEA